MFPHLSVIFTITKMTIATMMNVIRATRKLPTPKFCSPATYWRLAKSETGNAKSIAGNSKPLAKD